MRLENTQSFNRYSYVWNNPLKNSDPSGEIMLTGGYNYTNVNTNVNTNYNQWQQESAPTIAPLWIGNEYTDIIGSMEEILYATGVGVSNEQQYMATQMHSPPSFIAEAGSLEIIAWGDDIDGKIIKGPASEGAQPGLSTMEDMEIDNHICYAKDVIHLTDINLSNLPNRNGSYNSISTTGVVGGGLGFEFGYVTDSTGASSLFFTISGHVGLDAGISLNSGKVIPNGTHSFLLSDWEGEGAGWGAGFLHFGGGESGNFSDNGSKAFMDYGEGRNGYYTRDFSRGLGTPDLSVGGSIFRSKTWTFFNF